MEISGAEQLYWNIFETASDGVLITELETGAILAANPAAADLHGYTREAMSGLPMLALIHPRSQPVFSDFSGTIRQGRLFASPAQHVRRDGSQVNVEWRAVGFQFHGQDCALVLLRDGSRRAQAERRLHQRAGARAQEQSTLLEISQTLASTLELRPDLILDQLGMLIPYTLAGIFILEDTALVAAAVRGSNPKPGLNPAKYPSPLRIHANGKPILEALFNECTPIRIAEIQSDESSALYLHALLEPGSVNLLEGVRSWMWVPLAVKDRILGGIGLAHAEPDFYTPHHGSLAMTIANQAAVTLVNTELYAHARALAALQERQRLAQNLHDAVNQSLFSAGLIAEVLPRLWERDPVEARRSLEDLRRLTRGALAEMRALLAELRPATLTDSSLGDLLRQLANAFTGRTNIPVAVTLSGEEVFPAEVQVALYRICQEALNNIAKHARASRVEIQLDRHPAGLELRIRDDGSGFDPAATPPSGHYGLGMMRERADAAGISLTLFSQPGRGTEITLRWQESQEQEPS